jgi:hypothetical protein
LGKEVLIQDFTEKLKEVHFTLVVGLVLEEAEEGVLPLLVIHGREEVTNEWGHFTPGTRTNAVVIRITVRIRSPAPRTPMRL